MSPECLYWATLLALVLPSVPFNKTALAVLTVWAFGHIIYRIVPFDDAACMFARIIAMGAALAVSKPWDGSRRAYAQLSVAMLFGVGAALSAVTAIYFTEPAMTMREYYWQILLYWSTYIVIMMQAILVPFGNDWTTIKKKLNEFDQWYMGRLTQYLGGDIK